VCSHYAGRFEDWKLERWSFPLSWPCVTARGRRAKLDRASLSRPSLFAHALRASRAFLLPLTFTSPSRRLSRDASRPRLHCRTVFQELHRANRGSGASTTQKWLPDRTSLPPAIRGDGKTTSSASGSASCTAAACGPHQSSINLHMKGLVEVRRLKMATPVPSPRATTRKGHTNSLPYALIQAREQREPFQLLG
jgi:hypothetical protein